MGEIAPDPDADGAADVIDTDPDVPEELGREEPDALEMLREVDVAASVVTDTESSEVEAPIVDELPNAEEVVEPCTELVVGAEDVAVICAEVSPDTEEVSEVVVAVAAEVEVPAVAEVVLVAESN